MQINSNSPIYIQIAMDIKEQIMSNKFIEGGKLPSVRELASEYEVTALTVQRAMGQLEMEGIIRSKKGIGSFVVENCRETLEKNMIFEQAKEFVMRMKNMGLDNKKIEKLISEVLENE